MSKAEISTTGEADASEMNIVRKVNDLLGQGFTIGIAYSEAAYALQVDRTLVVAAYFRWDIEGGPHRLRCPWPRFTVVDKATLDAWKVGAA